jgi:hypothetical protein
MNHPAPTMGLNHQNEQNPKRGGGQGKEIDGNHLGSDGWRGTPSSLEKKVDVFGQESRHGSFRDGDIQFEQLPVDTGRSPQRVGRGHL